jgi:hypothetical protein
LGVQAGDRIGTLCWNIRVISNRILRFHAPAVCCT